MPTFQTNLLVRDNRVKLFEAQGCKVQYTTLPPAAIEEQLRGKLMEEATEAALQEDSDKLLTECADLYEVMLTLLKLNGYSEEDLVTKADEKRQRLGGFTQGIYTETLTAPEGSETAEYHRQYPEKYPQIEE